MPRAFVLGGTGFMGTSLVRYLVGQGWAVTSFSRHLPEEPIPNVRYELGDFAETGALWPLIANADIIFHYLGTTTPASVSMDPLYDLESNVLPSLRLCLELGKESPRIVFASSGGTVYGVAKRMPITEDHPTQPISFYGVSKLTIERYLLALRYQTGVPHVILRFGNVYGPGQQVRKMQGVVPAFMTLFRDRQPIQVWGDGTVSRDFIYIDDVTRVAWLVASYSGPHAVFNVGTGIETSIQQLIQATAEVSGISVPVSHTGNQQADVPRNALGCELAQRELGWFPKVGLEEGLTRTWRAFCSH